ncbi:hypothetical protein RYX36_033659 [Vicia faba]
MGLALVKLVYEKYLNDFEGWLGNAFKGNAACCLEISAEDFHSRKHELESSFGMVTWTRHIAKHPLDHAAKLLPEPSKWKERDVLSVRKHAELNRGSSSQKTADTDDDEAEFGSFGDGFGRKAIKHRSMEFMECSENTQCFDFQ